MQHLSVPRQTLSKVPAWEKITPKEDASDFCRHAYAVGTQGTHHASQDIENITGCSHLHRQHGPRGRNLAAFSNAPTLFSPVQCRPPVT